MFYAHLLLSKRGSLSKIWMAAHWDKKLTKAHIFECNLESAIQSIVSPKVTIALRTSGHLLLGVVRIYHRKAKYLLADCNEAFIKIKIAFRPGIVDLSEDHQEATYNAITLPEEFLDFDMQMPDINGIDVVDHFSLNQSRVEDITLREDYGRKIMLHDGFGEELEPFRHASIFNGSFDISTNSFQPDSNSTVNDGERDPFIQDCFGDEGLMAGFFDDKPLSPESSGLNDILGISKDVLIPPVPSMEEKQLEAEVNLETEVPVMPEELNPILNSTALLSNDGFILEPLDISALAEKKKTKRKRNLIVDQVKEVASSFMRQQLMDFTDTVTSVDIAPPTHKLMDWKMMGGVEWLLSHPCQPMISKSLLQIFTHCLTKKHRKIQEEQAETESEIELIRPEEEVMDLPHLEGPSYLQESRLTDFSSPVTEDIFQPAQHCTPNNESVVSFRTDSPCPLPKCPPKEHIEAEDSTLDSEERRWNKKSQEMLTSLRKLNHSGLASFSLLKICKNNCRKEASDNFYRFLVLKKQSAIELSQSEPYSDIIATPGLTFHSL
ncbi:double-strand-break repair protein rad21-like protein 1 [Pelodytes ibericus]